MTARESIAEKVQAGGAASLTAEESVDVLKMIHELGRHETAALDHQRVTGGLKADVAERDNEIAALRALFAKDRRGLWDAFAAAGLGSGKDADAAASQADQMMTRREARRA